MRNDHEPTKNEDAGLLFHVARSWLPRKEIETVVVACWQTGGTKAQNLAGGMMTRLVTGGFVGGVKWFEFGLIAMDSERLYARSFGQIAEEDIQNGDLNYSDTDFRHRFSVRTAHADQPFRGWESFPSSSLKISSVQCTEADFVTIKLTGIFPTKLIILESFYPGNVANGIRLASVIAAEEEPKEEPEKRWTHQQASQSPSSVLSESKQRVKKSRPIKSWTKEHGSQTVPDVKSETRKKRRKKWGKPKR